MLREQFTAWRKKFSVKSMEKEVFCQKLKLSKKLLWEVQAVTNSLKDWGCCPRCVLRFLLEKQHFVYYNQQEIEEWLNNTKKNDPEKLSEENNVTHQESKEDETSASEGSYSGNHNNARTDISIEDRDQADVKPDNLKCAAVCVTCLGILQTQYCKDSFLDELCTKSKEENHQFDTFYCSLTLPIPVLLREFAIWTLLKDKFREIYESEGLEDITSIKDVWKWVNGPPLADKLGVPFDQRSPYEIALNFVHPLTNKECYFLLDLYPDTFKKRKLQKRGLEVFTRTNVSKALEKISPAVFRKNYHCPPKVLPRTTDCDSITCAHEACYMAGRYNKYSRQLSQTPWFVDGGRKMPSSVQEEICLTLVEHIKPDDYRFSSSGREDVDVKMLGNGRPFVVEFINPHRVKFTREELFVIQQEINNSHKDIEIRDLQIVTRDDTSILKEGETDKIKCYTALCWSKEEITQDRLDVLKDIKDLVLKQKTPIRVLHRRPLAVREKTIHRMSAVRQDDHHFRVSLDTQAGTYIKEFVHGDFGRTQPDLGSLLGVDCDILELDVENVLLDWPPKLDKT